jgi:uncharacterized protein
MTKALLVFVKNPILGEVKTRLAQTVGEVKALSIYEQLLTLTCDVARSVVAQRFVYYSSFINNNDQWHADLFNKKNQVNGDLGLRMKMAFADAFALGHSKVVLIGSDCYHLTQEIIDKAYNALQENEVVIGPAFDGGYYLIGMNRPILELFDDITWSSERVLTQTKVKLTQFKVSYTLLEQLNDIDEFCDLLDTDLSY